MDQIYPNWDKHPANDVPILQSHPHMVFTSFIDISKALYKHPGYGTGQSILA